MGFKLQLRIILAFKTPFNPPAPQYSCKPSECCTQWHKFQLEFWVLFHQQARGHYSSGAGNAKTLQGSPTIPTPVLTFPLSAPSAELGAMPH